MLNSYLWLFHFLDMDFYLVYLENGTWVVYLNPWIFQYIFLLSFYINIIWLYVEILIYQPSQIVFNFSHFCLGGKAAVGLC